MWINYIFKLMLFEIISMTLHVQANYTRLLMNNVKWGRKRISTDNCVEIITQKFMHKNNLFIENFSCMNE